MKIKILDNGRARLMLPTLSEIDQITKGTLIPRTPEGLLMEEFRPSRINRAEYYHEGGIYDGEEIPKTSLPMWDYESPENLPEFYNAKDFLIRGPKHERPKPIELTSKKE